MVSQKSGSASGKPRVPEPVDNIQVNNCKNPACTNFGVPGLNKRKDPRYKRIGANVRPPRHGMTKKSPPPSIRCKSCGETIPLKSNAGIVATMGVLTWLPGQYTCPNRSCQNNHCDLRHTKGAYYRYGRTRWGTPRYRCRACGTTFVISAAKRRKREENKPYRTEDVFRLLLNGSPIKRIIEVLRLSPQTVYDCIDRAYEACLVFAAERESHLSAATAGRDTIYLSTDRQAFNHNWRLRQDKRNIILRAVVSTDVVSGYVFPIHLNYDAHSDVAEINEAAEAAGDFDLPGIWRRYPHYWLLDDYQEGLFRSSEAPLSQDALTQLQAQTRAHTQRIYAQAGKRWDVESPSDQLDRRTKLPDQGLQLREEYVLYAHFHLMRKWLSGFQEAHFFVDQESGIRAAYMSAFHDWVLASRSHFFYTKVKRGATREEREHATRQRKAILDEARNEWGSYKRGKIELLKQALRENAEQQGPWHDRWTRYPWGSSGEVEKTFSHQTSLDGQDMERVANILLYCSQLPTDRFMQRTRRRVSLLERGIPTAAGNRRIWTGRAPYNPATTIKVLEMLRVYVNYCEEPNKRDGNSPAALLGLARGPVELRKILSGDA